MKVRTIEKITIDALTKERRAVQKKLNTVIKNMEDPTVDMLEARTKALILAAARPINYRAFEAAEKEYKRLSKLVTAYKKRDYMKLLDKRCVHEAELRDIDSEISNIRFRMSLRRTPEVY